MRLLPLLLGFLVLLSPVALAGETDLAAHFARGGMILVTLQETGGASGHGEGETSTEEDRSESYLQDWRSDWNWTITAQLGGGMGRLGGLAERELALRAQRHESSHFEARGEGNAVVVRADETTECLLDLAVPKVTSGMTGRIDAERNMLVLEVTGIEQTLIPDDAWDPCVTKSEGWSFTDGATSDERAERGPGTLATSIHAADALSRGESVIVVEVPFAEGETTLPGTLSFTDEGGVAYCGRVASSRGETFACQAQGSLVVRVVAQEMGAPAPIGATPGAAAPAGEAEEAAIPAEAGGASTPGPGLFAPLAVALLALLVGRARG